MNALELKRIPKAGQYLMYVELSDLSHCSVSDAIARLEGLGYQPQLRYMETQNGLKLFALLRDEQHDPSQKIDDEYRFDEVTALFEAFPGDDMAIHIATGLPVKTAIAN